ncbi:MAG TPA: hypothetical protein IAB26_01840 [Candidatus Limivivens merdigallinarum]|uniref:BPTI/Kunitz inhibitor domain-containing protein n=1 Tax=Candidatus Limivivens merdigallinarum TaxID=2840859 RepID=A0A9D0ZSR4_9FIRM|nr:hypothetical protein [Candidatus Limivivens merdigallinarum]
MFCLARISSGPKCSFSVRRYQYNTEKNDCNRIF